MEKSFKKLLEQNNFTVKEFIKWSGKDRSTVYRWLQNDRCPYFFEFILNNFDVQK